MFVQRKRVCLQPVEKFENGIQAFSRLARWTARPSHHPHHLLNRFPLSLTMRIDPISIFQHSPFLHHTSWRLSTLLLRDLISQCRQQINPHNLRIRLFRLHISQHRQRINKHRHHINKYWHQINKHRHHNNKHIISRR